MPMRTSRETRLPRIRLAILPSMPFLIASAMAFPKVSTVDASLESVLRRGVLRVAADVTEAPWYFEDPKTGTMMGFEYEFVTRLAAGIRPRLRVEIVNTAWEAVGDATLKKRADIGLNSYYLPPPGEGPKGLIWSRCYFDTGLSVLYRASRAKAPTLADLPKGKVGVFPDGLSVDFAKAAGVRKTFPLGDTDTFAEVLRERKADFILYDTSGLRYVAKRYRKELKVTPPLPGSETCYGAMAPESSRALISALDRAIASFKGSAEYEAILAKYR